MARLLVTGATGRLGHRAVPFFRAAGHEVTGIDRSGKTDGRVDLRDSAATARELDRVRPDIVLHLAALSDVDLCEDDPAAAYENNVRSTENIASWIRRGRSTHLVLASTDQVYDGEGPNPEDRICVRNVYAFSKRTAELAALRAGATCLRFNFFGRVVPPAKPSLSDWIVQSLREKKKICLLDDVRFGPLSIGTLLAALARVVERPKEGIYNLGSHDGLSKYEFGMLLAETLGLQTETAAPAQLDDFSFHARRPHDMRMDLARFESEMGMALPSLATEVALMKEEYGK